MPGQEIIAISTFVVTCHGQAVHQISPPGEKDLERMNIHEPGLMVYQAREYGNRDVADMKRIIVQISENNRHEPQDCTESRQNNININDTANSEKNLTFCTNNNSDHLK